MKTRSWLHPRELQVAELLATTDSAHRELAAKLGLRIKTFRHYSHEVYRKLGVKNRILLTLYWRCELFQEGLKR